MNKKYKYLIAILLIVTSFIAFSQILGNDFINYDDDKYITENDYIKNGINAESARWAFTAVVSNNWHPLTLLSHIVDWSLFKDNAGGHHLVSLLWHIGSVILLFLFLNKTTGSLWPSAFIAALFALHPLRVESVAWASERKDVLSVFFGLASLYAYAYYAENSKLSKYFFSLMLFVLSLMAKPMLVTLPFILLLLDYWPLGRWQKASATVNVPALVNKKVGKKKNRQRKAEYLMEKKIVQSVKSGHQIIGNLLWEKVPFIFLAAASSVVTIWAQRRGIASLDELTFSDRITNAIVSYVAYLGKTFWPVDLAILYPYEFSLPSWKVLGAALILLGISIVVIYAIKKAPFLFVGWFWYLGTLVPVIGLVQVGIQSMADRYTYLPSIGISIMLVWGIVHLLPKEKLRKIILIPAAIIILTVLTLLTWRQCGYWKNSITLFSHVLQATTENYIAHINLGLALKEKGGINQAISHYYAALKIRPDKDNHLAHNNLGLALAEEGEINQAIIHFRAALKIRPNDDDVNYNLAKAFTEQGKFNEAIIYYREALRINPYYNKAHNNLAIILCGQNKYDEAIYHFQQALQVKPDNPDIHFNLGLALGNKGDLNAAIEHFRQAVYLKPDYEEARQALNLALDVARRQKR